MIEQMANSVLIDTSTFYSASKADFQSVSDLSLLSASAKPDAQRNDIWQLAKGTFWNNKATALSVWQLVESVVLYNQVVVDANSIQGNQDAKSIAQKLPGVVTFPIIPNEDYDALHTRTLRGFEDITADKETLDLTPETELNLILGHFERDLDRIVLKDSMRRSDDGNWFRFYSISVHEEHNSVSKTLESLLALRWKVKDKHLRRYLSEMDSNPMGLWPMLKVYLNFFRVFFYYNLASYHKINYCPHPLRNDIWQERRYVPLIAKDVIRYFEHKVRKAAVNTAIEVFPSLEVDITVPSLYKYMLADVSTLDDLFRKACELRELEVVKRFRHFCADLESAYRSGQHKEFHRAVKMLRKTGDEWAASISAERKHKILTVKDPMGIVSTQIDIPDLKIPTIRSGPLVFLQTLMDVI